MADTTDNKRRRTILYTTEAEAALQRLRERHPGRTDTELTNRGLEVWDLIESQILVDGELRYVDAEGAIVRLRIFP
jgi:hypothetical protein